jgi:predicted alpha/beta-fold hydrolase
VFIDKGTIALDWIDEEPSNNQKPILVIMPGLTSNNNECYVLNILIEG